MDQMNLLYLVPIQRQRCTVFHKRDRRVVHRGQLAAIGFASFQRLMELGLDGPPKVALELLRLEEPTLQAGRGDLQIKGTGKSFVDFQSRAKLAADHGALLDGRSALGVDIDADQRLATQGQILHPPKFQTEAVNNGQNQ